MTDSNLFSSYMKNLEQFPVLEETKIRELFAQYQNGSKSAEQKIINHNLRLVVKIAHRYEKHDGDKLMDLISEGNFGLMRAVEKFDLSEGIKFGTYAYRWIQFRIEQYFSGSVQAAYCPTHVRKLVRKIAVIERKLEAVNFQGSYLTEICNQLVEDGVDTTVEEASRLRELNRSSLSVDYSEDDESESNLSHVLTSNVQLESVESTKDLGRWVQLKIESLPENQKRAIKSYFGCGNVDGRTMKMVGEEMGYTSQRAQQIVKEGLKSLKAMAQRENIDFSMAV